jgi:hypothetical protein
MKTDDNGYRILVRAMGNPCDYNSPRYDNKKQDFIAPDVDPEPRRRQIYEKLGLDPNEKPTMNKIESPDGFFGRYKKERPDDEEAKELWEKWAYNEVPHTFEEFPILKDWLEENTAALDLLAEAVRKPAFCFPFIRENENTPIVKSCVPVEEVQVMRNWARAALARANHRVTIGDIDGAIEDILTVYRLGRHVAKNGMLINYFVGIALEGMAHGTAIADNPDQPLTKAQLEHFLRELDNLPPPVTLQEIWETERLYGLGAIHDFFTKPRDFFGEEWMDSKMNFMKWTPPFFDANVAYTIINRAFDMRGTADWEKTFKHSLNPLRYVTVQSRSEQVGYALANSYLGLTDSIQNVHQRLECTARFKRLTLALLLYEAEHGSMPVGDWREAIKPYLGEVPDDYFACPSGEAGYALVLSDEKTSPETAFIPLLVETKWENISDSGTVSSDLSPINAHSHSSNASYRSGAVRSVSVERPVPCC